MRTSLRSLLLSLLLWSIQQSLTGSWPSSSFARPSVEKDGKGYVQFSLVNTPAVHEASLTQHQRCRPHFGRSHQFERHRRAFCAEPRRALESFALTTVDGDGRPVQSSPVTATPDSQKVPERHGGPCDARWQRGWRSGHRRWNLGRSSSSQIQAGCLHGRSRVVRTVRGHHGRAVHGAPRHNHTGGGSFLLCQPFDGTRDGEDHAAPRTTLALYIRRPQSQQIAAWSNAGPKICLKVKCWSQDMSEGQMLVPRYV